MAEVDSRIDKTLKPYRQEYQSLQTIPGVKEHSAVSLRLTEANELFCA